MREKIIDHCARTLKCERLLLHKKTSEVSGETDKEKLLIFNVHYRFIHNESCLRFIEKSIAAVKNEINLVEDDVLALIIVILKSFLNKFSINLTKQFYVDSDEIFNYIVKYFKFYLINLKRYMPEHTLKITCLYAVQLLVNADLIEELKINTASCSFFKTKKNYSIVVDYSKSIDEYMIFSYNKYKLIEYEGDYYVTSGHFFTTYEIFRKNFNSNRGFKLKNIEYIMNKINSKIYVDSDYQESLKNLLGVDRGELLKQINERTVAINNYYKDLN